MQCKQCGYRLWNLTSRQCPECGQAFKPSEFKYVPSSVAFCCPHCDQSYLGTDPLGHPSPRVMDCAGCGQQIHMDEMILRPNGDQPSCDAVVVEHPWLKRNRLRDMFPAWLATVCCTFVRPSKLAGNEGNRKGTSECVKFILFNAIVIILPCLLLYSGQINYSNLIDSEMWLYEWMDMLPFVIGLPVFLAGCIFIGASIWALLTHGLIRLMSQPKGDIDATIKSIFYTSGVLALFLIPYFRFVFLLLLVIVLWFLIGSYVLKIVHGVSAGVTYSAACIVPLSILIFLFWGFTAYAS